MKDNEKYENRAISRTEQKWDFVASLLPSAESNQRADILQHSK